MSGERKYTPEEKQQLLANFDLEVSYRLREFEEHLAHILDNFRAHHEGQVLRIPRPVRGITMAEFGDKYNGDVQACLRGLQKERVGGEPVAIDPAMRKRKWQEAVEEQSQQSQSDAESVRLKKTRTVSPLKRPIQGGILAKAPGTPRSTARVPPSPSPSKFPRPGSPTKSFTLGQNRLAGKPLGRVPSTSTLNPAMNPGLRANTLPRKPRKNESMLSVNGSPLAPLDYAADDPKGGRTSALGNGVEGSRSFRSGGGPLRPTTPARPGHAHHKSQSSITSLQSFPSLPNFTFDPLTSGPQVLDKALAASDLTDSAQKKVRDDVVQKVRDAVAKWHLSS